jgi:ATP-dependent DNA ligase
MRVGVRNLGLEGVVSKVPDSVIRRCSNYWVKRTCAHRETLTIAGFAARGDAEKFGRAEKFQGVCAIFFCAGTRDG